MNDEKFTPADMGMSLFDAGRVGAKIGGKDQVEMAYRMMRTFTEDSIVSYEFDADKRNAKPKEPK